MKRLLPYLASALGVMPIAAAQAAAPSGPGPGDVSAMATVSVTATVVPHVEVEVDAAGRIVRIISNGRESVAPEFVSAASSRRVLKNCASCEAQYARLLPSLDFSSGAGVIYQRD